MYFKISIYLKNLQRKEEERGEDKEEYGARWQRDMEQDGKGRERGRKGSSIC